MVIKLGITRFFLRNGIVCTWGLIKAIIQLDPLLFLNPIEKINHSAALAAMAWYSGNGSSYCL